ncbi:UDP-4-amino-4,6-dideoxy-N-acetyl-beta-L-altrosamine transaminase [Defluviimonas sp. SAOS-178_SWC]|uniref:UDP-4-amino-4, 6-dideoxy-N-acetyl-beta-L-altrosamine transaminase n=1 Tax=Defluviimonas sp. SAOS-178_SWC TaxID=3121287 RepID=UPI003221C602
MIPYGRQDISDDDIAAVTDVLKSDFLTQGPAVPRFEASLRDATGAAHAVAVNSATSALHIACMALDLGPGDRLWTVPNTFVASANVGLYCGAEVDFVDIDPETYVMCPDALAAKLEQAEASGRLPKIVIPVHFAGQSADMAAIGALAHRYRFRVIEDASHAIGASYRDRPVGDCAHSDICVFSFHPVKIVTTAEGGCATTNDPVLAQRMELHRSHGVTREPSLMEGVSEGGWYYEQVALGYNYRMTELQAALGVSQMTRLQEFVARRHEVAQRYDRLLGNLAVTRPRQSPDSHSALHLYPIQVEDRARVFADLRAAGIGVNVHYIPVHTQPFWRKRGFRWGDFPVAEGYYRRAISLPLYPGLTEADQDRVVAALSEALDGR